MPTACDRIGLDSTSTNIARLKRPDGRLFTYHEVHPPAGGIDLEYVPLVPAAHNALSLEEFEARIVYYQVRVEARLPLFVKNRLAGAA